jgi:hypothetical protein
VDPLADFNPAMNSEHYIDGQHNKGVFNSFNDNVYGYCYQNPIKYEDPNGKQTMAGWSRGLTLQQTQDAIRGWQNAYSSETMHKVLDGAGTIPALGEFADGANAILYTAEGDYLNAGFSAGAMVPIWGWASTATKYTIKLGKEGIEFALKNTSRLQHAFKHANDIKQFTGVKWNNATKELWKKFNENVLSTATKSFDNILGQDKVKGFYKKIDGQNVVTYIYKEGKHQGEIATTVVLTPNQMKKFKL